jgi:hypothetical protein
MEYLHLNAAYPIPPKMSCVRTDERELTLRDTPRPGEVYGLEHDPAEFKHL